MAPRGRTPANDGDSNAAAGLLPAGLRDVLPPRAEWEAQASERLIASFTAQGYARVKPPLIEFEETLLAGSGQDLADQMFRVMDPVSQRMMGLRTDITLQVARIAASRMKDTARPLRLAYAGQVLRVRGTQLRPERQFAQVGVELIGSAALAADVEVAVLAAEAVASLGVTGLSLDITQPLLAPAIIAAHGLEPKQAKAARRALDRKDAAELKAAGGAAAPTLLKLLALAGPAKTALEGLKKLKLPEAAAKIVADLDRLVSEVSAAAPDLLVTLDPGEFRGFEYHTGIAFHAVCPQCARRTGPRRALYRAGRRNRHRFHALPRQRHARFAAAAGAAAGLSALRHAAWHGRAAAPGWPCHLGGAGQGIRRDQKAAKAAGCSHWWDGKAVQPL